MTITLRIVLIIASICTTFYMLRKIRQSKAQIEDSIFWFAFSLFLIILSIFPQIADFAAKLLGIQSTVNFLFLFMIFVLLVKLFYMTLKISLLENKLRELVQKVAIDDNLRRHEINDNKLGIDKIQDVKDSDEKK